MARAISAWAINRGGKNSVCNLRYGPRTRLVRGIYFTSERENSKQVDNVQQEKNLSPYIDSSPRPPTPADTSQLTNELRVEETHG